MKNKFAQQFEGSPLIVQSPGRINLIGEHTDYNDGFVMPAAIDKGITFAIAPSATGQSVIYAENFKESFTIPRKITGPVDQPQWANYLLGVLYQLQQRKNIPPFNCMFEGDLPVGAGLSSSAALECGFAFALNELFELNLSQPVLIKISQWAEHNFAGVKCGIMDQFSSVMGKKDNVILLDCRSLEYTYSPLKLEKHSILLCNTNIKHSLASSEYNVRRAECEQGVAVLKKSFPYITSLRDVTIEMLLQHEDILPPTIYNRCKYVVEENIRVQEGALDLQRGDIKSFGIKMFETHHGLSSLYQVSCPELDFLVDFAQATQGVLGARMMGGGFGGCTINIIDNISIDNFIAKAGKAYTAEFGKKMTPYIVNIDNGTRIKKHSKAIPAL